MIGEHHTRVVEVVQDGTRARYEACCSCGWTQEAGSLTAAGALAVGHGGYFAGGSRHRHLGHRAARRHGRSDARAVRAPLRVPPAGPDPR